MDNTPAQPQPRLLKGPEVAEHFRVSNETVSRWARAGLLRSVTTPSGRRLYPADQLDDFTDDIDATQISGAA